MAKRGMMPRGGGGGGGDLMKQIQQMQSKMAEAQAKLEDMEFEASSGGGAVHVVLNAHPQLKSITIQPDVLDPDDVDMVQDLIMAALNDALEQVRSGQMQQLAGLAGGLNIPGLDLG